MMKNNMLKLILYVLLLAAPLLLCGLFYAELPDQIPMRWGFDGSVDYSNKSELIIVAALSPIIGLIIAFAPKLDPQKANYSKFSGAYDTFRFVMAIFMLGITTLIISEGISPGNINISMVTTLLVGGIFIIFGNVLPKVRRNYFMGIRTPWTLASNEVWHKTHHFAGWAMFAGGLVMMLSALFLSGISLFVLLMIVTSVVVFSCVIMSYVWYKQLDPMPDSGIPHEE